MAQAIRERQPVRDAVAIAERPDGSRAAFRPYPTPLFDEHGNFTGAVNMLIDVTDQQAKRLPSRPSAAGASPTPCTTARPPRCCDMAEGSSAPPRSSGEALSPQPPGARP